MPRRARMYVPGLPYHIVQRGNNREACFAEPENYQFYLELWREMARRYGVAVHAYCLMTNHVHFLATPVHKDSVSNAMKVVGSRYAQYMNCAIGARGRCGKGGPVQPGTVGTLSVVLLSLYRTESGSRGNGAEAGGISLVQLRRQRLGRSGMAGAACGISAVGRVAGCALSGLS